MARPQRGRVGLTAVAKEAGVSTATVSNTLNHPDVVAAATREKVLAVIARMDFVPNTAAASLRRGSTRLIGLVVPDISNPFYSEIARGVADAADRHRYGVILCNSQDDPARELDQLEMLAENRVAGALIVPVTADRKRLARLRSFGTHLVLVDRDSPDGCSVAIDDVLGGRIAAQHLIETRGPGFVLVNGSLSISQCADRREGARAALSAAGVDPDSLIEYSVDEMTTVAGVRVAAQLAERHLPTSIFCTNDLLAIGVMRGLATQGVAVPDRVAVVGYGDLSNAVDASISLTTVEQPKHALGIAAVEMLLAELNDKDDAHRHSTQVFRPTLVVRVSAPARQPAWV